MPETVPSNGSVSLHCKTHGVYLIKTATCHLCEAKPLCEDA